MGQPQLTSQRRSTRSEPEESSRKVAELYARHAEHVHRYLQSRCGSGALADDLTQATFEHAVRLAQLRTDPMLTQAWLFTVAQRRLVDHWRSEERKRRRGGELRSLHETDHVGESAATIDDGAVKQSLNTLPTRQQRALWLRYVTGLSVSEVASSMDTSYTSAESLLARGRRAFRLAYSGQAAKDSQGVGHGHSIAGAMAVTTLRCALAGPVPQFGASTELTKPGKDSDHGRLDSRS